VQEKELIDTLTKREREVASLVAQGASNYEAAVELGITERTVKDYLVSVYDKLRVRNRLHLVIRYGEQLKAA
jgi:DNA-binding CsgD family transcriptional regulator